MKTINKMIALVEEGLIDKDDLILELMKWMGEYEVSAFAEFYEYIKETFDGETEEN